MQREGTDFLGTSSPTPVASFISMIAVTALQQGWTRTHRDIEQAFVQSRIDRDIYVRLPDGCECLSGKVARLHKSSYRLRQSPRVSHQMLMSKLREYGSGKVGCRPERFPLGETGRERGQAHRRRIR